MLGKLFRSIFAIIIGLAIIFIGCAILYAVGKFLVLAIGTIVIVICAFLIGEVIIELLG